MKYKVGNKVRIKSLDWYNQNKDNHGAIYGGNGFIFWKNMARYCGTIMKIAIVKVDPEDSNKGYYFMENSEERWTDEMIECKVEEENKPKYEDEVNGEYYSTPKYLVRPSGYQFIDENGNIINARKVVLKKKHNDILKLESTKKVREYRSEYARIFIEIYDDEPNECILTHLYTLESHRQKGYGKQVLSETESIAKELGCHTAYLKVETDSWMYNWYLRCGYQWYKNADKGYTWLTKNL